MSQKNPQNWSVISREYLSREPWFTARRECVELPDGTRIPDYYILEYPDWINVIAVTEDKKMVLVRQYRHGLGRVFYELTAGTCEKTDPDHLAAAKRELQEETGYAGGTWRLFMTLSANPGTHTNLTYTFLAEDVELVSGQSLDASEDIAVHLFSEAEVFAMLQRGEFMQALMAAPLWKYFYEKQITHA